MATQTLLVLIEERGNGRSFKESSELREQLEEQRSKDEYVTNDLCLSVLCSHLKVASLTIIHVRSRTKPVELLRPMFVPI